LNSYRPFGCLALLAGILSGCASVRELNIGRPLTQPSAVQTLPGAQGGDGDDYYVQFVSEFDFKADSRWQEGCQDIGSSYAKGGSTSLLMFQVKNDALGFSREVPGFIYQSAGGRCNFSLDAKKVYLSPWMRLDSAKGTQIDYSFVTSKNGDVDLGKLARDVNAASNVLALTGVGTGVALMGKIASGWMLSGTTQQTQQAPPAETGKRRQESRSLPPLVTVSGRGGTVSQITFPVYETVENKLNPFSKPRAVGAVKIYGDAKSSLLLKTRDTGLPDARDLSLEELWRSKIQGGAGDKDLEHFIATAEHPERPDLQPDWNNYREVELNCRRLKVVMKDLGFNKYDRNAVLYYFLDKNPDWKNYNVPGQKILADEIRLGAMQQYRNKNFGGCLTQEDYESMKAMGLPVNSEQDWATMLEQIQQKESYFGAIRALERQLVAVIKNPNPGEMERQAFPLIATRQNGNGTVLLQNHLGNFGLEKILNVPAIPGDGLVINAGQLAQVFTDLKFADFSCARAGFEQGRPIKNVAILLFATDPGSPLAKGGALEFEFDGGKIARLAFQHPAFRDFKQDVLNHPEIGDCRIDTGWFDRVQ
jgi:hypothetical protein